MKSKDDWHDYCSADTNQKLLIMSIEEVKSRIRQCVENSKKKSECEQVIFDWLCDNPASIRRIVWHLLDAGYLSLCEVAEMREENWRAQINELIHES